MSASLRYRNPDICEHLASQYVVAVATPRVRARIETLRKSVPELDAAIISWSEDFAKLQHQLPEKSPRAETWSQIESLLGESEVDTSSAEKLSRWNSLLFWRWTGIGASLASIALIAILFVSPIRSDLPSPLISATPNYVAVMSPAGSPETQSEIRFVVNVYQKTESAPSRLFIQWSERQPRNIQSSMHLWAKDRDTGALTYIGVEPDGDNLWEMDKPTWLAVSNSSDLLFTRNKSKPNEENTLFTGPCIQLGSWKHQAI